MKDKLKLFLDHEGLTAAYLADRIGVQRSSFSHILNGRNKPSADFITKLLQVYPDLNANWLFGSSDNMLLTKRIKSDNLFSSNEITQTIENLQKDVSKDKEANDYKEIVPQSENKILEPNIIQNKKVAKIVFFYNDNSFREYLPE
ncbi:MAG: helix-turn-helix transcriptional regulator [Mariniphaga sp.]|nr:helix-turn-helix transcriptional regulator [Mariniphaga sp.]